MEQENQSTIEPRTRKVPPKGTTERREYERLAKRNQRERERQEKLAKSIPKAFDYKMPTTHQKALDERTQEVMKVIRAEVPERLAIQDEYVVEGMASVLFGLENDIVQEVHNPDGLLVGGYFPDVAWSNAIKRVHEFPIILESVTFAALYKNFLRAAMEWNSQTHGAYSAPEFIPALNAEMAGTYVLKSHYEEDESLSGPVDVSAEC
jgi:hypothetical protein